MIRDYLVVTMRRRRISDLGVNEWVDFSDQVRSVSINRGKSSGFSAYPVSSVTIELNNQERLFDPTRNEIVTGLPGGYWWNPAVFMGTRRVVEIGIGVFDSSFGWLPPSGGESASLFSGYTHDWNLSYTPQGESIATLTLHDFSGVLAKIPLDAETPSSELSGARYEDIFTRYAPAGIPQDVVDTGLVNLGTQAIDANTPMLDYLSLIAKTEGGDSFSDRFGRQRFRQRVRPSGTNYLQLGIGGVGISSLGVNYGTELLYNKIIVQNDGGSLITVEDITSQDANGVKDLSLTGLIGADDDEALKLGSFYVKNYSEAKVRFSSVEVKVNKYDDNGIPNDTQLDIVRADIGDYVSVSYQPNGFGDTINRFQKIIGVTHTITPRDYFVSYSLDDVGHSTLILDDAIFGKLDVNRLA